MPRTGLRNLLTATAFLFAGTAAASETQAPRCRVGNGKSSSYKDSIYACLKARAEGKQVTFLAPKTSPKPIASTK